MSVEKPSIEYVLDIARKSECSRRKYGVSVWDSFYEIGQGYNQRVGKCCNGNVCVRDRLSIKHGTNTDAGAEIHAEQAALINTGKNMSFQLYLAGLGPRNNILIGFDSAPCYSCARMLRYAGYEYINLPNDYNTRNPIWDTWSIAEILERWEQTWENGHDA